MILKNLSRTERVSKLNAISTSRMVQSYNMFSDYYEGIHFIKTQEYHTDYGKKNAFRIATRSGTDLYDEATKEDKVVIKSNWCAPIIETIGDYTRGINEPMMFSSTNKEDELRKIWRNNQVDTLTREIAYDSGIFGKTYLRLRQKSDKTIEISNIDPAGVYEVNNIFSGEQESIVYWFGIDREEVKRLYPDVPMLDKDHGDVFYAEEWDNGMVYKYIDGYIINEKTLQGEYKDINPYGFIPFFEISANVKRASDIVDIISLNDDLNITYTYSNEIFKYSAFPMLAPKGTFSNDTPILEKSQLQEVEISPRTILPIPMERVGGGGVDDSVYKHIDEIKKDISIVSGVPMKLLMAEIDGNTSGVALERMLGSVMRQAESRRGYITEAYIKISKAILKLLGSSEESDIEVTFPDMVKIDTTARLDDAIKKQTLGISQETILDELGYDYEEESKKKEDELNNSMDKALYNEQLSLNNQKKQDGATGDKKGNATGNNNAPASGK